MRLIEKEDRISEERAEKERERTEESRIQSAIKWIKEQDREVAAEQQRKKAETEAERLAHELHGRAIVIQQYAEGFRQLIEGYADVRRQLLYQRRRAGYDTRGRWERTNSVLVPWFRSIFGGQNSLVDVPAEQVGQARVPNREVRTLAERDPLTAPRTNPDDQAS